MSTYKITDRFVELYFDSFPSEATREALKAEGWWWFRKNRCWSAHKSEENIRLAQSFCKSDYGKYSYEPTSSYQEDDETEIEGLELDTQDLVIRSNSFYCDAHHDVESVAGVIEVLDRRGEFKRFLVPLTYCRSCDAYYILEDTYQRVKSRGIIMHQLMTNEVFQDKGKYDAFDASNWREESPLHLWGYNVSSVDGLTDAQRQMLLTTIIDKGVMSKDRVLSYLSFFIKLHHSSDARNKWRKDRDYIADYKIGSVRKVYVGNIQKTFYRYR